MKDPRLLFLTGLLMVSLTASRPIIYNTANCGGFEFRTELSKTATEGFGLSISARGGKMPYYYLLFDDKNNLVSNDFSKNAFTGLATGRYRCIVADANDCTKEQFIEVK